MIAIIWQIYVLSVINFYIIIIIFMLSISSLVIIFLELLSFFVEWINDGIEILEDIKRVFEHLHRFALFENNEAVSSLVESTGDLLIQDHLTQLLQHSVKGKTNLLCHEFYLHFWIGFDDFSQVVFQ